METILLFITIALIVSAIAEIASVIITHRVLGKQIIQLGDDVRVQRNISLKNLEDANKWHLEALKWKGYVQICESMTNGTAYEQLVNHIKQLRKNPPVSEWADKEGYNLALDQIIDGINTWENQGEK